MNVSSLKWKFIVPVVVSILVIIGTTGLYDYTQTAKDLRSVLDRKVSALFEITSLALVDPVWNMNDTVLRENADALLKNEEIALLQVLDISGKTLYERRKDGEIYAKERLLPEVRRDIVREGQKIGAVLVCATDYQMRQRLNGEIVRSLVETTAMVVILGLIVLLVSLKTSRPIVSMAEMLKNIAEGEGDLTKRIRISRKDELGQLSHWFNRFVENIEKIIASVKDISAEVDNATHTVASGTQGLSQTAQEQAAAMEQVVSTIEEISSSIEKIARNADAGRSMARDMVGVTNAGEEASRALMDAMNDISLASQEVGDIITTVNEVAFQTNLLALNAAVEAARAGEHGKGFAVVAGEVRALAQKSATASSEIKRLIEDTVSKIKVGGGLVTRSVDLLEKISSHVKRISEYMDEFADASAEQTTGVSEVSRVLVQIDGTTQQNASTVEEIASVSDTVSSNARELTSIVAKFIVSGGQAGDRRGY